MPILYNYYFFSALQNDIEIIINNFSFLQILLKIIF